MFLGNFVYTLGALRRFGLVSCLFDPIVRGTIIFEFLSNEFAEILIKTIVLWSNMSKYRDIAIHLIGRSFDIRTKQQWSTMDKLIVELIVHNEFANLPIK